jgi:uncharacterized protein YjdB
MRKQILLPLSSAFLAAVLAVVGCGGDDLPVRATGLELNKAELSMSVGATEALQARVEPANATKNAVAWASSDDSVATVSEGGLVTAVAAGRASVRATLVDGGGAAVCGVTVAPLAVTGVGLDKSAVTLYVGGLFTLTETVLPHNATDRTVSWASSSPAVAGVSGNGTLRALSVGATDVTVTANDGGHKATCKVTVAPAPTVPVDRVTLNKASLKLAIDSTETLVPTVWPGHATNRNVSWSSSNTAVATVSAAGLVSALTQGSTVITVRSLDNPEKFATCQVSSEPFFPAGVSVYVSGYIATADGRNVATLWTNGASRSLVTTAGSWTQGESVFSSGTYVYTAGYNESGNATAHVWRTNTNGTGTVTTTNLGNGRALSVFVDGSNVYASGHNANAQAVIWRNGSVLHNLTANAPNAWAESVYVSGADVYAAGWVLDSSWTAQAAVWKNGVATNLWDAGRFSRAHSVFVHNGDVYVVGLVEMASMGTYVAMLWKNGERLPLTDGYHYADPTSLFVTEAGDVYVTGHEENEYGRGVVTVWKNGELYSRLSSGEFNARGESIFVLDDDVYVAGYDSIDEGSGGGDGEDGTFIAVLWKNDVRLNLSDGTTWAEALSVYARRN